MDQVQGYKCFCREEANAYMSHFIPMKTGSLNMPHKFLNFLDKIFTMNQGQ